MSNYGQLLQIRQKKLGLLIANARQAMRRTIAECADATGLTPDQFQEIERGAQAPSLPQLELLSLYLNVSPDHFWGSQALPVAEMPGPLGEKDRLLVLRNRVIGANLRLLRNNASLEPAVLSEKTGIPEEMILVYEMGSTPVPLPELELLAEALGTPLEYFYDQHGPVGKWRSQQGSVAKYLDLPPDVQRFISAPVNRPYLDLAMRLSELNVEKLRAVAELLLEITY